MDEGRAQAGPSGQNPGVREPGSEQHSPEALPTHLSSPHPPLPGSPPDASAGREDPRGARSAARASETHPSRPRPPMRRPKF